MQKKCPQCEDEFEGRPSQKFCSKRCSGLSTSRIREHATAGGHALRGRSQSPEHIAKRAAATQASMMAVTRACVECAAEFRRRSPGQKFCSGQCYNAAESRRRANRGDDLRKRLTRRELDRIYAALVERDGDRCRICGEKGHPRGAGSGKGRLQLDHCHDSGAIRGLLCANCNRGLGYFLDRRDLLRNAITYLDEAGTTD